MAGPYQYLGPKGDYIDESGDAIQYALPSGNYFDDDSTSGGGSTGTRRMIFIFED